MSGAIDFSSSNSVQAARNHGCTKKTTTAASKSLEEWPRLNCLPTVCLSVESICGKKELVMIKLASTRCDLKQGTATSTHTHTPRSVRTPLYVVGKLQQCERYSTTACSRVSATTQISTY
eukprot:2558-Heterococcus_DN1.PRE.1